eukprot:CAMPEP_0113945014 /NCGR_PEP_ID=MMETSP1339-20121228/38433_1 /TAXON_ID=94617 /ORGANISM="Fibrocapsa japonica" /LENGTH=263 /DNA_ID=CAMNT_0000950403 /DNA_START=224 /DNA_END=1015 /DNA_ORIENTATION=- /assembly_acc=CAM_ASM_000762
MDGSKWTDENDGAEAKAPAPRRRRPRPGDDAAGGKDDGDDAAKPSVQQGWGSPNAKTEAGADSTSANNENDEAEKKNEGRRRARWDDEATELIIIPDMDEEAEEDITTKVAAAPRNTAKRVQSLRELEHDLKMTVTSSANGIDLSLLTAHLVPAQQLQEEDITWDFDALLQEVTQEFNAEAEKRPNQEKVPMPGGGAITRIAMAAGAGGGQPTLLGVAGGGIRMGNRDKKLAEAIMGGEDEAEEKPLDSDIEARLDAMLKAKK